MLYQLSYIGLSVLPATRRSQLEARCSSWCGFDPGAAATGSAQENRTRRTLILSDGLVIQALGQICAARRTVFIYCNLKGEKSQSGCHPLDRTLVRPRGPGAPHRGAWLHGRCDKTGCIVCIRSAPGPCFRSGWTTANRSGASHFKLRITFAAGFSTAMRQQPYSL